MSSLIHREPACRHPRTRLAALLATPRVSKGLGATLAGGTDATTGPCSSRCVEGAWSPGSTGPVAAVLNALAPAVAWAEKGSLRAGDALDFTSDESGAAQRKVAGAIMGDGFNKDEAALLVFGAAVGEENKVDRLAFKAVLAACGVGRAPRWRRRVGWSVARMWMRIVGRALLERIVQVGREARGEWEGWGRFGACIEYCDLEFERKVGEGAFAEVWKGTWMAEEVAIKRFHGEISVLDGTRRLHGSNPEHKLEAFADLFRRREWRRFSPIGNGKTVDEEASDSLLQYASRILSEDTDSGGQVLPNVKDTSLNIFLSDWNSDTYKSFLAEVAALNKLRHPNIAKYVPCHGFHCPVLFRNYVLRPCF